MVDTQFYTIFYHYCFALYEQAIRIISAARSYDIKESNNIMNAKIINMININIPVPASSELLAFTPTYKPIIANTIKAIITNHNITIPP